MAAYAEGSGASDSASESSAYACSRPPPSESPLDSESDPLSRCSDARSGPTGRKSLVRILLKARHSYIPIAASCRPLQLIEENTAMLQIGTLRPTDSRGIPVAAREEARAVIVILIVIIVAIVIII